MLRAVFLGIAFLGVCDVESLVFVCGRVMTLASKVLFAREHEHHRSHNKRQTSIFYHLHNMYLCHQDNKFLMCNKRCQYKLLQSATKVAIYRAAG